VRRRARTKIWHAREKRYAELVRGSGLELSVDLIKPRPVVFEPLHPDVLPPKRATSEAAGFDLRAYLIERRVRCSDGSSLWEVDSVRVNGSWCVELMPSTMALIPLGFRARLPEGFEAQIRPRSGATFKKGLQIPNAPGTVDADYPDEWLVLVRNATSALMRIEHGERVAQAVLHRFHVLEWVAGEVQRTTGRGGGFGSTGS
jgi:dUTP pyrophosphatase